MSTDPIEDEYPESTKLSKVAPFSNKCGEFIDWLSSEKGICLAAQDEDENGNVYDELHAAPVHVQDLLAEFFEIDMAKVETERRAMLAKLAGA